MQIPHSVEELPPASSTKAKADKAEFTDENLENEIQVTKEAKEHKLPNHILIVAQVAGLDLLDQSTKSVKSLSFCVVYVEEANGLHCTQKINLLSPT